MAKFNINYIFNFNLLIYTTLLFICYVIINVDLLFVYNYYIEHTIK